LAETIIVVDSTLKFIHYENIQVAFGTCNTVLIKTQEKNILVDPGHLSFRNILKTKLAKLGLQPKDIDIVINTHMHFDHFANNYLFKQKPLYLHRKDLEYMENNYWPEMTHAFISILHPYIIETDTAKIVDDVSIIATPGHTPGSISVVVHTKEGVTVIAGDAISTKMNYTEKKEPLYSINREEALKSIEKIMGICPLTIIPGHDKPFYTNYEH